jgi:nitroimidazol reductase NimA-like FMN-containing flavoprotein (pyridoxamine 5'-phosphate oxidase superfamily)
MQNIKQEIIGAVLNAAGFAVLATESNGQPHTSLVAVTPTRDFRQIIFATYRNTLKYNNLSGNNKVALLMEDGNCNSEGLKGSVVLTIVGHAEEISPEENEEPFRAHLKRHPELESFMHSPDCVLVRVIAHSYQVVNGIDDIRWITAGELDTI